MLFLLNLAAFQIGWFSSVIGGAQQMPWLGPVIVFAAIGIHFYFASQWLREAMLILSCALIGAVFDSVLVASNWVEYPSGLISASLAPYWIVTMWMLFGTTLNVSMRWLRGRELVAAAFGLLGGPLSYLAGQKLGGISLVDELAALTALGLGWAVIMPLLLRLAAVFDGIEKPPAEPVAIAEVRQ